MKKKVLEIEKEKNYPHSDRLRVYFLENLSADGRGPIKEFEIVQTLGSVGSGASQRVQISPNQMRQIIAAILNEGYFTLVHQEGFVHMLAFNEDKTNG